MRVSESNDTCVNTRVPTDYLVIRNICFKCAIIQFLFVSLFSKYLLISIEDVTYQASQKNGRLHAELPSCNFLHFTWCFKNAPKEDV